MNFLSHYYFERKSDDSGRVLGTVLPDLVKNAQKSSNLYPQKSEGNFKDDIVLNAILQGWKRHLELDRLFHSSQFFMEETAKLKQLLLPILKDSVVRPSFLAHIGVELMLDHLLVNDNKIAIGSFYEHLEKVNGQKLLLFLKRCGLEDTEQFFKFFSGFKSSRYLLSYQKLENISYALQRICMRLWPHPFSEDTLALLTTQLETYKLLLEPHYLEIFDGIERKLTT